MALESLVTSRVKPTKSSVVSTVDIDKEIEEQRGFIVSTGFVNIGNGEQNIILFRNPGSSIRNVRVKQINLGVDDNNTRCKVRVYLRPGGLTNGVGLTEENLNLADAAPSSSAKAFDGTTVSTNPRNVGFVFLIPANSPTVSLPISTLFLAPGDKILVTVENSVNNKPTHCDIVWIEEEI